MDGLLLDTESIYTVAQKRVLERHGREFTFELKAKMMGKKALDAAEVLVSELGLEGELTPEEFVEARESILDELFPTAAAMPGAERLVAHLKASGVPIAVATSSHRRHFEMKTRNHKAMFDEFDHVVTGDEVSKGKPDPEIFQKAASAWQGDRAPSSPGSVLVFEDAPVGAEAAAAAGMPAVLVPDARLDVSRGVKGATVVIGSLEDFKPEEWGLPAMAALN